MHSTAPLCTTCLTLALVIGASLLTACAPASSCVPAPLDASLEVTAAGATLAVSAAGVDCDPAIAEVYTLTIVTDAGPYSLGTAIPADDGSFTQSFPVPLGIVDVADGIITVEGSSYDQCDDGADCAGYQTALPTP